MKEAGSWASCFHVEPFSHHQTMWKVLSVTLKRQHWTPIIVFKEKEAISETPFMQGQVKYLYTLHARTGCAGWMVLAFYEQPWGPKAELARWDRTWRRQWNNQRNGVWREPNPIQMGKTGSRITPTCGIAPKCFTKGMSIFLWCVIPPLLCSVWSTIPLAVCHAQVVGKFFCPFV